MAGGSHRQMLRTLILSAVEPPYLVGKIVAALTLPSGSHAEIGASYHVARMLATNPRARSRLARLGWGRRQATIFEP